MAKKSVNARYEARNRKMRAKHKKETGRTLSKRHTSGTAPARIKFACRFGGMAGGMTKPNGEPTNLKMAFVLFLMRLKNSFSNLINSSSPNLLMIFFLHS